MTEPSPEMTSFLVCQFKAIAATSTFFDGVNWFSVADVDELKEPYAIFVVEDSRQDEISDSMWTLEYLLRFHQGNCLETDISEPVDNKETRDERRLRFGQVALEVLRKATTPPANQAYFLQAAPELIPDLTAEPGRWHIEEARKAPSYKALEGDQITDDEFVSETRFTVRLRWVPAASEE